MGVTPCLTPTSPPNVGVPDHEQSLNSDVFDLLFYFLYQLLEVPRGLWRSGNVPKRVWDVLELLYIYIYIEFLIKIYKTNVDKSVFGNDSPPKSTFFRFDYTDQNISARPVFLQ